MRLSFAPQERTLEWERTRVSGPPQDKKTVIFRSQCAGCAFADIILLFSVWAFVDIMWVCTALEDICI